MSHNLADVLRKITARKRDYRKEWSPRIQPSWTNRRLEVEQWLAAEQSSPSQQAIRHRRALERWRNRWPRFPKASAARRAACLPGRRWPKIADELCYDQVGGGWAATPGTPGSDSNSETDHVGPAFPPYFAPQPETRKRHGRHPHIHSSQAGIALEREQRLGDVIAAYLEALEARAPVDRAALAEEHPDLAAELALFFANQDHVARLTAPLRDGRALDASYPAGIIRGDSVPAGIAVTVPFPGLARGRDDQDDGASQRAETDRPASHGCASNDPRIRYFGDYELIEDHRAEAGWVSSTKPGR